MACSDQARHIRAVILDVDGVLTDGRIGYGPMPGEIKFFDVRDGHAIKLLLRAGLRVGLLSGRASDANRQRAAELGLSFVYEGEKDKAAAFTRLLAEQGLAAEECLYMGDDLVDLPVLRRAGIGVAVADAVPEVRAAAAWTTEAPGGRGAVREAAVWLLRQQGAWERVTARYGLPGAPAEAQ
jgi:3-deoxy-D-manno-octulosonate 8-phosphate phosphatase (KDO 8-P phosphatase)